ncbi:MAG: PASTA domain-containing protein [Synergistaceae bacterium]|nr:PASTA domain-containing protein [Synergistaceae bacterium]
MGKIFKIVLLLVAMIIFASGAVAIYAVFFRPEVEGVIPNLKERSIVDAVAEAERLGFVVQIENVASTLPEGRVLAQSPEHGTESRKGQVIVLQVSQGGGELHDVPDVRGKTLAEAQSLINSQGFSLGDVVRIKEPNTEAGKVIAQSPAFPASINSGRKIDLLVQEGTPANKNVLTVPDVNRMSEKEARNILEAAGVKVTGVDKVYSPLLPEGLAIETRPSAGSTLQSGQGVILKLATQKRPAGFMDSDSNSNVRRVTNQPQNQQNNNNNNQAQTPAKPANNNRQVSVQVQGQEEIFIGDDYELPANNNNQAGTQNQNQTQNQTRTQMPTPSQNQQRAQTPAPAITQTPAQSGGSKTAPIRYIVPPIARPMELRIEITDPAGKRTVLNRQVRSGESINTSASYTNECIISYYLGGESVWQEKRR